MQHYRKRFGSSIEEVATTTMASLFLVTSILIMSGTFQRDKIYTEATGTSIKELDVNSVQPTQWKLCSEEVPGFKMPCLCAKTVQSIDATEGGLLSLNGSNNHIMFNCDHVSISANVPVLPPHVPMRGYSHQYGGFQNLEQQLFSESNLTLQWVDFSHNHLHRLTDRLLEGVKSTLEELRLGHNYLGHQLNPIFATNSFNPLTKLRILDLSYNMIKSLDDGLFHGLDNLNKIHLEGNYLNVFPKEALKNVPKLVSIHLQNNRIDKLYSGDFSGMESLQELNLSHNVIHFIESGSFSGLSNLTSLDLSSNMLKFFANHDVFFGIETTINELDLSDNFLGAVPTHTLTPLRSLKVLRLSSNGIRSLKLDDFAELSSLRQLDLSRNRITELPPTVFSRLSNLDTLLLDVNLLLKVENPAFDGLYNLRQLSMSDNNILGLPTRALTSLPALENLDFSYNRISAISFELFKAIRNAKELYFEFNLVREIPNGTFLNFTDLRQLSFRGNNLRTVFMDSFAGLEGTINELDLSMNELEEYPNFPQFLYLEKLDLSYNHLTYLPEEALAMLPSIRSLNLEKNKLTELTVTIFNPMQPSLLEHLDLGENSLGMLLQDTFSALTSLKTLDLSKNDIKEIKENTFYSLPQLRHLDLSENGISVVHPKAFGPEIHALHTVNFSNNQLTVFDGGIFTTVVSTLKVLDVSNNHIHYLIPNSFSPMPALQQLNLDGNKLTQFLHGVLSEMPYLEQLSLHNNHIQQVESGLFSHAHRLRVLTLSHNKIETLGDGIFYNSSQVKKLDLSYNKLATVPHGTFDGIARLKLDLSHNNLSSLPSGVFSRDQVVNLQSLNLSYNNFNRLPLSALNEQSGSLEDLVVNNNHLTHIPSNTNILVNVKRLDLSENPLSEESLHNIFAEPKTVRELKLFACGITTLPALETPFLRVLNLSNNAIHSLQADVFKRVTLLEVLDLAGNNIDNSTTTLSPIWPTITGLRHLDLSRNSLKELGSMEFSQLTCLESLLLSDLHDMGRFDDRALNGLKNLKSLSICGYPRLGFYDIRGPLETLMALESLEVEIKTAVLRDQLHFVLNSRLRRLVVSGKMLKNLTSVSFAGFLAPEIEIGIRGTSLSSIPNTIFLPLPTSAKVRLDLTDNLITTLGPQILTTLDEKRHRIGVSGLDRNPLVCDCTMKPMKNWIHQQIQQGEDDNDQWKNLQCYNPEELRGLMIAELQEQDLTCEKPTTTTPLASTATTTTTSPTTTELVLQDIFHHPEEQEVEEPDIIYEAPSPRPNHADIAMPGSLTNMDSMIIGIIVGVVAFICILIIIICVIKLRHSRVRYRASTMHVPSIHGACTCLKPPFQGGTSQCNYPSQSGTLPTKLKAIQNSTGSLSSLPRSGYYHNQQYFVTYPESDADYR